MTKTEEIIAKHPDFKMFGKAGDVLVVQHKQGGDPYIMMLLTPIIQWDNGNMFSYIASDWYVSRFTQRVIPNGDQPSGIITMLRTADEDEKAIFFQAISDSRIEGLIEGLEKVRKNKLR